jgi:protein-tyrosine phosphatase
MEKVHVLFVCLGNICRSPTAEGVFRHVVELEGLTSSFVIDSAGTGAWHVGEPPDERATETARGRGISLEGKARKVTRSDFERFHYVVAMDRENRENLLRMAPTAALKAKVHLFRAFDPASPRNAEVPDPYYGGARGFEEVFDICDAAARGLLAHLREEHGL